MYAFRKQAVLAVAVIGLVLALAGCSGSGSSDSKTTSNGGTTTYTNDKYGFSITCDKQFTQGEPVAGSGAGGSSVLDVVFADKDGTVIADRYVDAIQVSVYELARAVKPTEVPELKSEIQGIVDELMGSVAGAEIVEPLQEVDVNGIPGFAFKYTYSEENTELTAVSFFLIKGKSEYQITAQTTSENWDSIKSKLEGAVESFKVQ